MRRQWMAGFILIFSSVTAAQTGAHEHGAADLSVAVDGSVLLVELSGALDNLAGFEHAPRNETQRQALFQAAQHLELPEKLFELPAQAQCSLVEMERTVPYSSGDNAYDETQGHADFHASYRFDCAVPQTLTQLEIILFDAFPRIQRLRAVMVTPAGQNIVTLNPVSRGLHL